MKKSIAALTILTLSACGAGFDPFASSGERNAQISDDGSDPDYPGNPTDPTDPGDPGDCFAEVEACYERAIDSCQFDADAPNDLSIDCEAALMECDELANQCEPQPPAPSTCEEEVNECFRLAEDVCQGLVEPNAEGDAPIFIDDECEALLQQCEELAQGCEQPEPEPCQDEIEACFMMADEICQGSIQQDGDEANAPDFGGDECEEALRQCEELAQQCEQPQPEPCQDEIEACFDAAMEQCSGGLDGIEPWNEDCDELFRQCEEIAQQCGGGEPPLTPCEEEINNCFERAIEECDASGGNFDPAIGEPTNACDDLFRQCEEIAQQCEPQPEPCEQDLEGCFDFANSICQDGVVTPGGDLDECYAAWDMCSEIADSCVEPQPEPVPCPEDNQCFDDFTACLDSLACGDGEACPQVERMCEEELNACLENVVD